MFLLWAVCMLMTASVELGPQQWQNSVLTKTSKISGTWILMYTSFMMFLLRHFAGPIAHRLSPVGMLTGSAVLTAVGLYLLSFADSAVTAFTYATIFGLGIVYFWPTMLGVTAERFPKGGAFLLGMMGCVGNLAVAAILPLMGSIYDNGTLNALPADVRPQVVVAGDKLDADKLQGTGKNAARSRRYRRDRRRRQAFRKVAALPIVLFVIFGSIAVADRLKGGYKPEELTSKRRNLPKPSWPPTSESDGMTARVARAFGLLTKASGLERRTPLIERIRNDRDSCRLPPILRAELESASACPRALVSRRSGRRISAFSSGLPFSTRSGSAT